MAVLPTPVLILVEHEPRSSYGIIGYIARAFSVKNFDSKSVFVVQVVLLLVALAVYAAACYQALGRIFLWTIPPQSQTAKHLWLPSRYITPLFVRFDVFAFAGKLVSCCNLFHLTPGM